jgi:multiple sugar transport system substrate-binding protein
LSARPSAIELRAYGDNGAGNDQVIGMLVEGFTRQHPEIKVKVYQFSNYPDKQIPDLVKGGNPPDLIMTHDGLLPYLVENGLLLNLREFMAGDLLFNPDGIQEQALQSGRAGGEPDQYVLPIAVDTVELFYNKDLFKKAGVPEPSDSWTWDDLTAACKKIQAAATGVVCLGTGFGWTWPNWYPWVRGFGGDIMSAGGTQSTYSSAEVTSGLRAYTELWTKHHIAQSPDEAAIDCFSLGKCAVTFSFSTSLKQYLQQLHFNWGTQLMPRFPKGRSVMFDATGFGIARVSQHPQQAWQLLKYLVSPDAQRLVTSTGLGLPALKAASTPAAYGVFAKGLEFAVRSPDYPNVCGNLYFGDAQSVIQSALKNAVKGYDTLENGLKLVDSRMNQCLVHGR